MPEGEGEAADHDSVTTPEEEEEEAEETQGEDLATHQGEDRQGEVLRVERRDPR